MKIDIENGDIDILVDGQQILHIGQVSDSDVVNLFLYSEGDLIESLMHKDDSTCKCTHEILVERKIATWFKEKIDSMKAR